MQVGFIGLGRMGSPIARSLVEAGHLVGECRAGIARGMGDWDWSVLALLSEALA